MPVTPRPGGASSSPQLPAWTFTSGAIGAGKFTTDNPSVAATTNIVISASPFDVGAFLKANFLNNGFGAVVVLTDASGAVAMAQIASCTDFAGDCRITGLGFFSGSAVNWDGEYTMSFVPPSQFARTTQGMNPDSGWTANADGGDKTTAIPDNATINAMQAALNLVVAGFGDAFVAVADKCKALETALTGNLLPNA